MPNLTNVLVAKWTNFTIILQNLAEFFFSNENGILTVQRDGGLKCVFQSAQIHVISQRSTHFRYLVYTLWKKEPYAKLQNIKLDLNSK